MHFTISKEKTFIPTFRGNNKVSADEQIVVTYKVPTVALKSKLSDTSEAKARADRKGNIDGIDIVMKRDDNAVLDALLLSIEHCEYTDDDGKNAVINNADSLKKAPVFFAPLYDEIVARLREELENSGADEKN